MSKEKRPKPWTETRPFGTRCVWRFEDVKYRTSFYEDAEEARADAMAQITEQMKGTWRDRSGSKILLEEWIDIWVAMLDDIEPTTKGKYKYLVEAHILTEFQGRQIGSLTFEEIEKWEKAIPTRTSARGRPYAKSVATGARSLLITILGDAVHAGRLDRNPAERRKGRRGKVRAKGRAPTIAQERTPANVITPLQALVLAERTALLSGRDIDFIMNITAAWTGTRWGELIAFEGSEDKDSPLQLRDEGISTYAVDWQLRELGGVVTKSAPKDGSYRVLDLPPFLADLLRWARDNRSSTCSCPLVDGHPACKGNDPTPPNYLFLGPRGGHPRRSNYADRYITPAAEGLYPSRNGTRRPVYVKAEPWPGIPITKGNKKVKAADLADTTWPNLTGHFRPTTTATPTPPGSTPPTSRRSSRWTAAATRCPAWTPSTTTSPPACANTSVMFSKPSGRWHLNSGASSRLDRQLSSLTNFFAERTYSPSLSCESARNGYFGDAKRMHGGPVLREPWPRP